MKFIIILLSLAITLIPVSKDMGVHGATIKFRRTSPVSRISQLKTPAQSYLEGKGSAKKPKPVTKPHNASSNEQAAWNFLIKKYGREKTAGIMGNLMQEHKFNTSDVPSGLGIAQWLGNRRSNLIARGNYLDINVQLEFLHHELKGYSIREDLVGATVDFQNKFERCGRCNQSQRIQYAQEILGRH